MTDEIVTLKAMQDVYLGDSVRAVIAERVEQITKHDYGAAHDDNKNAVGQLISATRAVLALSDPQYATPDLVFLREWPWHESKNEGEWLERMSDKDDFERLAIAAALILAEMDRIDRIAKANRHDIED